MNVTYSARSHIGNVRDKNEDNLYADGVFLTGEMRDRPFAIDGSALAPMIFAVCDGMGGEEDGEKASLTAVGLLAQSSERIKSSLPADPGKPVQEYISAASEAIRSESGNTGKRTGTTLALAIVAKSGVHCFNVGDSRIYSLKSGALVQVTNDHTLAAERARNGELTAEQARREKGGNKLTRCMGIGEMHVVDAYPLIRGCLECRILICSDGLTDMLSQNEIETTLKRSAKTSAAADSLLESALERGGRDNVTIVVIDTATPRVSLIHKIANKLMMWGRT
jgi:protein phosphatase